MGLLLYPDDSTHVKALEKIKSYDYALILHNMDMNEDGEFKKEHYHVIIKFKNACWRTAIAKELGIKENYIEQIRNEESALEYLIHYNEDEEEKHKYDIEQVQGPLKRKLVEYINKDDKSEGERVSELLEFIESHKGHLGVTEFARYCALNGYWDIFRRAGAIFVNIINEHNDHFAQKNEEN
jgi:hypothetical protein